jgi:hypothetical protein
MVNTFSRVNKDSNTFHDGISPYNDVYTDDDDDVNTTNDHDSNYIQHHVPHRRRSPPITSKRWKEKIRYACLQRARRDHHHPHRQHHRVQNHLLQQQQHHHHHHLQQQQQSTLLLTGDAISAATLSQESYSSSSSSSSSPSSSLAAAAAATTATRSLANHVHSPLYARRLLEQELHHQGIHIRSPPAMVIDDSIAVSPAAAATTTTPSNAEQHDFPMYDHHHNHNHQYQPPDRHGVDIIDAAPNYISEDDLFDLLAELENDIQRDKYQSDKNDDDDHKNHYHYFDHHHIQYNKDEDDAMNEILHWVELDQQAFEEQVAAYDDYCYYHHHHHSNNNNNHDTNHNTVAQHINSAVVDVSSNDESLVWCPICQEAYLTYTTDNEYIVCPNYMNEQCTMRIMSSTVHRSLSQLKEQLRTCYEQHANNCTYPQLEFRMTMRNDDDDVMIDENNSTDNDDDIHSACCTTLMSFCRNCQYEQRVI